MLNIRKSSKYVLVPSLTSVFLVVSPVVSPAAHAGENITRVEDAAAVLEEKSGDSAAERIEAADIMRVLTQTVSSAACHYHKGIAPEESKRMLSEATVQFDAILAALHDGDDAMHIYEAETRRKTLRELDGIKQEWAPVEAAVSALLENPNNADALELIKFKNLPLLNQVSFLLNELQAEYANPAELLQVDAMRLVISGRQGMLTQKLAKEACEIWAGNRSDQQLEAMRTTMEMYEVSLNALRDGLPSAGVAPPPTAEIKRELEDMTTAWTGIKAELTAVLENGDVSDEAKARLYHELNAKTDAMEQVTHLYVTHSKHEY